MSEKLGIERGLNVDRFLEKKAYLFRSGEWLEIDNPIYLQPYNDFMDCLEAHGYYNEPSGEYGGSGATACIYKSSFHKKGASVIYPYIVSFDFNAALDATFDGELIFVEDRMQLLCLLNFLSPVICMGMLHDALYQLSQTIKQEKPDDVERWENP